MSIVLVVTDADWLRDEVVGTLARRGLETISTADSRSVVTICDDEGPELIVCDSQVGSKGFMAVCRAVRSAESQGRIPPVRFLALLDRRPDISMARRADADAWLVKPYEPAALRWTADVLLADEDWDEETLEAELRGELQTSEPDEAPEADAESELALDVDADEEASAGDDDADEEASAGDDDEA